MRVIADEDCCIASKQCSAVAPMVFGHDDDGIVVVRQDVVHDDMLETARYAARICPSSAIRLVEEGT